MVEVKAISVQEQQDIATLFFLLPLRYLAVAASLTSLLEVMSLISKEWSYIWKKAPFILRIFYLFTRYGAIVSSMAFLGFLLHPPNADISLTFCRNITSLVAVLACLGDFTGNALAVFRIFVIWDRDRKVLLSLSIGCLVALASSVTFAAIIVHVMKTTSAVQWLAEPVNSCVVQTTNNLRFYYMAVWTAQIIFDLYAVCLVLLNALSIPRKPETTIWGTLYQDGMLLMLTGFLTRLSSIILVTQSSGQYVYGLTFNATIIAAFNCRLVLILLETRSVQGGASELIELRTKTGQSYFTSRAGMDQGPAFVPFSSGNPRLKTEIRTIKHKALYFMHQVGTWGSVLSSSSPGDGDDEL